MDRDTFSRLVKDELARVTVKGRSPAFWEAAALRKLLSSKHSGSGESVISADPYLIRRLYYLIKQSSGLTPSFRPKPKGKDGRIQGSKLVTSTVVPSTEKPAVGLLSRNATCRRAFIRGSFLARGSISSPSRSHHLEIALPARKDALLLQSLLRKENLKAGLVQRRSSWVVYLKDSDEICELLKLMGATSAVFEYENIRARKSLRNSVQRIVNMDDANVSRAVEAGLRQIEDIRLIDEERGLSRLPPALKELARLRLENPEASMEDLGLMMSPPISKSAVNHRFRRLAQIASDIRANKQKARG
ncbi:MAG TPA: DNA-binding protein WhiA [Firmicutes bacterium]|nr:DNA-binding protein WhiA [Candidatus Fermentithermobacillaceae bacterium]